MENFVSIGLRQGLLVAFWITGVLLFLTFLMAVIAKLDSGFHDEDFFEGIWSVAFTIFAVFAVLSGSFTVGLLAPFDSKYHHSYRVSGEVTEISNVLSDSGGSLTRTPVLTMEGVDRDIVMDDPRAVNLQGKNVDLTCTVNWVYQGADEYRCIIYKVNE